MDLKLLYYPSPKLREVSEPIDDVTDVSVWDLIDGMCRLMYDHQGQGLSAIQTGHAVRVFVADVGLGLEVYVNPVITFFDGDRVLTEEGCLSVPGFFAQVQRYKRVVGYATNKYGERIHFGISTDEGTEEQQLRRFHTIQHEIEHLDGEIFVDHLGTAKREQARNLMKKRVK